MNRTLLFFRMINQKEDYSSFNLLATKVHRVLLGITPSQTVMVEKNGAFVEGIVQVNSGPFLMSPESVFLDEG